MKLCRFFALILTLMLALLWGCGQVQSPAAEPATLPASEPITVPATEPPTAAPITLPPTEPVTEPPPPVILDKWLELLELNEDFVGWVNIPNTIIDYPVVYCADNYFYLHHDFNKNKHQDGTVFLSMEAELLTANQSMSLLGHHRNNGLMFSDLHKFKQLSFLKKSPYITFNNLYEDADYVIFSVFYMAGNADDGNFYYYLQSEFGDEDAFLHHLQQLQVRSIYDIPVDVTAEDQIIILTCCTYETDDLRISVAARKLREGESIESIDFSEAVKAKNPLYPAKWYAKMGGKAPEIDWISPGR